VPRFLKIALTVVLLLALVPGQTVAQDSPGPYAAIDIPSGSSPVTGSLDVAGWAIDTSTSAGTGVDRVTISLDDTYVEDARYGSSRPDIATAYGGQFGPSGWLASLDIQSLVPAGGHTLQVSAHSVDSDSWTTLTRQIQVVDGPRFGVDFHPLSFDLGKAATDLDRVKANGLDSVRFEVNWDSLEPNNKGEYDASYLAKLDAVVGLTQDRGLRPVVTILRTPAWARTGGTGMTPPSKPSDYGDVMGMLAARYASVPGITYEIWNEPNSSVFWNTPNYQDPAAYTALLQAAYASIKAAAPGATVLGGALVFNDPDYLTGMYADGAQGSMDGLSLHPYSRGFAPDDASVPSRSYSLALSQSQSVLAEHADSTVPIWVTEMGWSTAMVSDATRADYYRRAVQIVRANPQIDGFYAFELNQGDDSTAPVNGLIAPDGTPTASWKAYGQAVMGK
jgi:hypothetical protein